MVTHNYLPLLATTMQNFRFAKTDVKQKEGSNNMVIKANCDGSVPHVRLHIMP